MKAVVNEKSMEDVWKELSLSSSAGDGAVFQGMSLLLVDTTPTMTRPFSLPLPLPSPPLDRSNNKRTRLHNNQDGVRHKRMVKNRESAARSRARKQAYAYELELEIVNLRKENAMLKKQLQNKDLCLCLAKEAPAVELLEKPSLQRTLTAPF